jgi:aspartate/methionine/tyrosine aminotransferase
MTGWRLGAAIAPAELSAVFGKLNTNNESCTTHFVQWAGIEAIRGDQPGRSRSATRCRAVATRHTSCCPRCAG